MSAISRNRSSLTGGILLILAIIPLFLSETTDFYYVPIYKIITLFSASAFAFYLVFKKEMEDIKYLLSLSLTIFFFLISEIIFFIYALIEINYLLILFYVFSLASYLPVYILLVRRVRKDERLISRNIKIFSLFVTVIIVMVMSPFVTSYSRYLIENKLYMDFIFFLLFLIVDFDILAISVIFIYLNLRVKKTPQLWLTIAGAWFFILIGDVVKADYYYQGKNITGSLYDLLYSVGYAIFLVGLIIMIESYERPLTISEINRERLYYQTLYEEINTLSSDLVTVTSLLRHDLYNDFVVIQNSLDLYKETNNRELLDKLSKRIDLVINRFEDMKTETDILDTLKTQAIDLKIIQEIASTFDNVKVMSSIRDIKVKASNLLYSIFINLIQNAFQHAGENVKVEIEVVEEGEEVFIKIKDNGIGITSEQKRNIFQKGFKRENQPGKGLGLYLVKIVIERYGGSICLEDNVPKGSVFIIKLQKYFDIS